MRRRRIGALRWGKWQFFSAGDERSELPVPLGMDDDSDRI